MLHKADVKIWNRICCMTPNHTSRFYWNDVHKEHFTRSTRVNIYFVYGTDTRMGK